MSNFYYPYIKINKEYNKEFEYTLYATSVHTNYIPENAIDFSSDNSMRYSAKEELDVPIYWSICFPQLVSISNYTFTEPDYKSSDGELDAHQKSWDFYGSVSNSSWIPIDSRRNMAQHNAKSYVGTYPVNNSGPFRCFKLQAVESYFRSTTLTFRRFDIYAKMACPHSYQKDINYLKISLSHALLFISIFITSK